jgi:hypothetical protein
MSRVFYKTRCDEAVQVAINADWVFEYNGQIYQISDPGDEWQTDMVWWWYPYWEEARKEGMWVDAHGQLLPSDILTACRIYQNMQPDIPAYEFLNGVFGG